MKKKLLYYGDTPNSSTGFGNVARHVLSRLIDRYDITVFGVNEFFLKEKELPVKIMGALPNKQNDPFGKQKFVEYVLGSNQKFDIWFFQNDIHFWSFLPELVYLVRSKGQNPHIFTYTVIDSPVRKRDTWNLGCVDVAGIPSQYGVQELLKVDPELKHKLRHIPHGIDTSEFFPLPNDTIRAFRQRTLHCEDKDFLIVNVNRNSVRKDIVRTLIYFKYLHKDYPNTKLYLHMASDEESYRGWDLKRVIDTNQISGVGFPDEFKVNQGIGVEILNLIYNSADMVISTSLGEGFGLSTIEAMATKSLVMMSDNSSISELICDGRGLPIVCGGTLDNLVIMTHDPGWMRPQCSVVDMLSKTKKVMESFPHNIVEQGYRWVTDVLNWNRVILQFIDGMENIKHTTLQEGVISI